MTYSAGHPFQMKRWFIAPGADYPGGYGPLSVRLLKERRLAAEILVFSSQKIKSGKPETAEIQDSVRTVNHLTKRIANDSTAERQSAVQALTGIGTE
jgi:hypothetical protein